MFDKGKFRLISDGALSAGVRSGLHVRAEMDARTDSRGVEVAFVNRTNPLPIKESVRTAGSASPLGGTLSSVSVFRCRRTGSPARSDVSIVSPLRPGSTEFRRDNRTGVQGIVESARQGAFEVEIGES